MIRRISKTSLPLTAIALLLLAPGIASANFQYVPSGSDGPAQAPVAPAPAPVTRMRVAPAPLSSSSGKSGGAIINGFGTQVPLVTALREIVPATYQFAYADGINLGTLVNWKGGKPWRTVLNEVVSPLGLTAIEKNMVIYIDRKAQ